MFHNSKMAHEQSQITLPQSQWDIKQLWARDYIGAC